MRTRTTLLALQILCFAAAARAGHPASASRYAPKTLSRPSSGAVLLDTDAEDGSAASGIGGVILDRLVGLRLAAPDGPAAGEGESGVVVSGLPWLATERARAALAPYVGAPLTEGGLLALKREVLMVCRDHDHPLVLVSVPEQDVTEGVLTLHVAAARLGEVEVRGNRWFDSDFLASQVRTGAGEELTGWALAQDIDWLNRNPFREVDMLLRSGGAPGTTDLLLDVEDRRPWRLYFGYEDTGNELLREERLLYGFNLGDVFGTDQRMDFQWTTAPDFATVNSFSGSYSIPLPWRHTLDLFGGYTDYEPDLPAVFNQGGESWEAATRYSLALPERCGFVQELSAGFQFRHSDNTLEFGGLPVTMSATDLAEFVLAWQGRRPDDLGSTALGLSAVWSPGWTSSAAAFDASRAGAEPEFAYGRLEMQRITRLPCDFTWTLRFEGQVASGPLIGSETFGLGGYRTVRGYEEWEVAVDDGILLSNEARSPGFSLLKRLGCERGGDQFQWLAFLDYGYGRIDGGGAAADQRVGLSSAGVGFRYGIDDRAAVRFDYGWQMEPSGFNTAGRDSRVHLGVTISY